MTRVCPHCGRDLSPADEGLAAGCPECGGVREAVDSDHAGGVGVAHAGPNIDGAVLRAATCTRCRHSLRGLVVREGIVTCPECGQVEPFVLPGTDRPARIETHDRVRRGCVLAVLAALLCGAIALLMI